VCVCLIVCDLGTSTVRRLRPESGRFAAKTMIVKRKVNSTYKEINLDILYSDTSANEDNSFRNHIR
jgi:hypothetical protein